MKFEKSGYSYPCIRDLNSMTFLVTFATTLRTKLSEH